MRVGRDKLFARVGSFLGRIVEGSGALPALLVTFGDPARKRGAKLWRGYAAE
jgi:hypothetical protein